MLLCPVENSRNLPQRNNGDMRLIKNVLSFILSIMETVRKSKIYKLRISRGYTVMSGLCSAFGRLHLTFFSSLSHLGVLPKKRKGEGGGGGPDPQDPSWIRPGIVGEPNCMTMSCGTLELMHGSKLRYFMYRPPNHYNHILKEIWVYSTLISIKKYTIGTLMTNRSTQQIPTCRESLM